MNKLSPIEKKYCIEFLKLKAERGTYKKIAEKFNHTYYTVRTRFNMIIFRKLRVHTMQELYEKLKTNKEILN